MTADRDQIAAIYAAAAKDAEAVSGYHQWERATHSSTGVPAMKCSVCGWVWLPHQLTPPSNCQPRKAKP